MTSDVVTEIAGWKVQREREFGWWETLEDYAEDEYNEAREEAERYAREWRTSTRVTSFKLREVVVWRST
jgi:hypothetical protein